MKSKILRPLSVVCTIVLIGSLWSCKKYIQVEPVSQYSIPAVFSDVSNATTAIIGVYDELQGDNGYGIRISLYYPYDSDEGITSGNLDAGRRGIGRYQHLLTNPELVNPFRQLYRGIEKANLCIEQIPQMAMYTSGTQQEQKDLRRLYGEALTLRAQFYFELIRNWGDVPAPLIPAYKQTALFIPRVNRDSTYDHLIADLKTAADLVPWRTEVPRNERITKGAVKALRARLALYRGGYSLRTDTKTMQRRSDYLTYYQIARDECAELMARREQHTLNPVYEDIWRRYVSSFQPDPFGEILFEVGAGGGNANSDSRMGNYDGVRTDGASRYGPGGGGINALASYFYAFDSVDTRKDVTIGRYSVAATNIKSPQALTTITNGKYRRDWRNPALPGSALSVGYNWVLIRFSDVLLMYAEAVNEINGSPTPQAIAAFEEVRKRAFKGNESRIGLTPNDKAGFFNVIMNERYLEFGFEAIRKYDLIRWNMLAARMAPQTGEIRRTLRQLQAGTNQFANVPLYIYWRNNGEEIEYLNSFYQPQNNATAPEGWRVLNWRQDIVRTNNTIGVGTSVNPHYIDAIAYFFTPNKSELFPFDLATMDAYQGKLTQNPNY